MDIDTVQRLTVTDISGEHPERTVWAGQIYQHQNGNVYAIVKITNLPTTRDDFPYMVTYTGEDGKEWTRPLHRFLERCTLLSVQELLKTVNLENTSCTA